MHGQRTSADETGVARAHTKGARTVTLLFGGHPPVPRSPSCLRLMARALFLRVSPRLAPPRATLAMLRSCCRLGHAPKLWLGGVPYRFLMAASLPTRPVGSALDVYLSQPSPGDHIGTQSIRRCSRFRADSSGGVSRHVCASCGPTCRASRWGGVCVHVHPTSYMLCTSVA